jgi:hypothetical protein
LSRRHPRGPSFAIAFVEQEGEEAMLGGDDFAPENLQVLRRASRISPAAIAELSGTGLIVYSGCVTTSTAT